MGLMLAEPGFHTRAFVEWEEYPRQAIIAAQRAGYFAPAPIWDDLRSFDGRPFCGAFDTILAGYPCQPFSQAGKRLGSDDPRHLWPHVARVIREVEPEWVFLENVAGHITLGAETVLRTLWDMGYTPAAGAFSAAETGAPHERERVFIVAHAGRAERRQGAGSGCISDRNDPGREEVAGWVAEPSDPRNGHMAIPESFGCDTWRAEHGVFVGRPSSAIAGGAMADASGPEREGQQRGQHYARGRQVKDGYSALPGRTGLFPPGPADMGRWSGVLADAPYLAPAASFGDLASYASQIAAMAQAGLVAEAQAQPALRRMADGMALRTRALRLLGNGVVPLAAAHAWRSLASAHGLGPVDMEAARRDCGAGPDGNGVVT